jgi:TolB-like protein
LRSNPLVLVAALAVGSAVLAAEPARPPLVVLDLEAKGATALQAEAATQGVVRGLRELDVFQVLSTADVRQLLAIDRSRQLMGAESGFTADLTQALGARHAVVGSVTKVGEALQVELRLLDTQAQKVVAQKSLAPVAKVEQLAAQLPQLAQELVAPLLQAQQGSLMVTSREEGAEVLVDDVLVGSTPLKTPLKLSRGTHRVQVRKDGFIAQTRAVRILPEISAAEDFSLIPSPDFAEAYQDRHGRLRVGAYLFTGVALAGIGGAIAVDRLYTEPTYQYGFLPRRAVAEGTVRSKVDPRFAQDAAWLAVYDDCRLNPDTCSAQYETVRGQLAAAQISTVALAAVGVIGTGVASYLWLTGKDPNRYAGVVATVNPGPNPGFVLSGRF